MTIPQADYPKEATAMALPAFAAANSARVLDETAAAEFASLSPSTFRRLVKSGDAPSPINLSARRIGWRLGELIAWIESKSPKAA